MLPVPFTELSSVQYMSTDEQLLLLTAALKNQFGRHCFIKIQNAATQPLRVPFITTHFTTQKMIGVYRSRLLERSGAMTGEAVDEANAKEHERWVGAVSETIRDSPGACESDTERRDDLLGRE
jgi:hypothetical protein